MNDPRMRAFRQLLQSMYYASWVVEKIEAEPNPEICEAHKRMFLMVLEKLESQIEQTFGRNAEHPGKASIKAQCDHRG